MNFSTPTEFSRALDRHIEQSARDDSVFAIATRRDTALERLVSRFDNSELVVKGAFAVRSLTGAQAGTGEIELLIDKPEWQSYGRQMAYQACWQYISNGIQRQSPDQDWFYFVPTAVGQLADADPEQPVARVFVQVNIELEPFTTLTIDVGVKPEKVPTVTTRGSHVLSFAGITNPLITTVSPEYAIADELSLYLKQGWEHPSHVVYAALLLTDRKLDFVAMAQWLDKLGKDRDVAHKLADGLAQPERAAVGMADMLCQRNRLGISGQTCFERADHLLARIYREKILGP